MDCQHTAYSKCRIQMQQSDHNHYHNLELVAGDTGESFLENAEGSDGSRLLHSCTPQGVLDLVAAPMKALAANEHQRGVPLVHWRDRSLANTKSTARCHQLSDAMYRPRGGTNSSDKVADIEDIESVFLLRPLTLEVVSFEGKEVLLDKH